MPEPQNNFLIFNENNNQGTTLSQGDYLALAYRISGLIPMIADPIAHNKMFRQWSLMCNAIGAMINDKNLDALDTNSSNLKNNLKSTVKGLARDELSTEITTLGNIDTWKESITATPTEINTLDGITASTAELNILDGVTASTTELNILDGVTVTSTDINSLSGVKSNIQQQINNMSVSAFIPLRQDNTTYAIGDVVKVIGLSIFEYLECIVSGITGDGTSLTGSLTIGNAYVDGTCVWLCCDMRDGLQVGDMKYRFSTQSLNGYITVDEEKYLIYFNKDNPIENTVNLKYLRLFRQMLNPLLYTYAHDNLFTLRLGASTNVLQVNPVLLFGASVVLLNQFCRTPLDCQTIEDITLQDYMDIATYNSNNSVSYTETEYKNTAQSFLDGLRTTGYWGISLSSVVDRYLKLQKNKDWVSRLGTEGLPNIVGSVIRLHSDQHESDGSSASGAFYWANDKNQNQHNDVVTNTGSNVSSANLRFNASYYNALYGNASHVTPASLHLCPFIKY